MRLIPAQIILIPMAAVISTLLMTFGWGHMSVREVSPILGSQEAIQKWLDHETVANHCLPWSININTIQQDALPTDPGKGHWFTTLRCNHRSIYVQWALLILAPWLIINLVLLLFNWLIPPSPQERSYDYFQ